MIGGGFRKFGKKMLFNTLIASRSIGAPKFFARSLSVLDIDFQGGAKLQDFSVSPYKYGYEAASCISIDFDHSVNSPEKNHLNHQGTMALVDLAERYDIPITWAICGEIAEKDSEAYQRILHSNLAHDIGVHTWSHRDLSDTECSEADLEYEVSRCISALGTATKPSTFVFPWNRESHLNQLRHLGFISYRPERQKLGYPRKKHGMWAIPEVYKLSERSAGQLSMIKRLLDLALAYQCVFHISSHPYSISIDGDIQAYVKSTLEPLFQYIDEKRREGRLWVCTMRELANYCEARLSFKLSRKDESKTFKISAYCSIDETRYDSPPQATISIPLPHDNFNVLVDGRPASKECIRTSLSTYGLNLFLTLTFGEPVKQIEVFLQ